MRKLIVLLGVAPCVAAYFTLRTTEAPSLWELETSITNHDTGLEVGVETDKANLIGFAKVGRHTGSAPARIAGGALIVDASRTPLMLGPDGRWTASVPLWTSGAHNVRVEVQEIGVAEPRFWEAKGIR